MHTYIHTYVYKYIRSILNPATGVDVTTVAEAFHLDPEVVEEVHRVQAAGMA